MLRDSVKALRRATPQDLRKFGLAVGLVFCLLAFWLWLKAGKSWWPLVGVAGLSLILLGGVAPRALRWVYVGWMSLALMLGAVVSTLLLALSFFVLVTPIAVLARLAGKDFLNRKVVREAPTYWSKRVKTKSAQQYEQQF